MVIQVNLQYGLSCSVWPHTQGNTANPLIATSCATMGYLENNYVFRRYIYTEATDVMGVAVVIKSNSSIPRLSAV